MAQQDGQIRTETGGQQECLAKVVQCRSGMMAPLQFHWSLQQGSQDLRMVAKSRDVLYAGPEGVRFAEDEAETA